jgi:hypothetical protein
LFSVVPIVAKTAMNISIQVFGHWFLLLLEKILRSEILGSCGMPTQ